MRVYVIGDVHGRWDLLNDLLQRIEEDTANRGAAKTSLVFLGDLIDRGPDSYRVVAMVKALCERGQARFIKGNHEEIFVDAARGNGKAARALLKMGGLQTLFSYGVQETEVSEGSFDDLATLLTQKIPRSHVDFLDKGEDMVTLGDYLLVHAGIRPGVDIHNQDVADLRWIRNPFLNSRQSHPFTVIHGHSISEEIVMRPNRIGIDTGAYQSGKLTAAALEGEDLWFLQAIGAEMDMLPSQSAGR